MTAILAALCVATGMLSLLSEDAFVLWGAIPGRFTGAFVVEGAAPAWLTLGSYALLHADLVHLGGNLWALWIFGRSVEGALGHARYAALYAAGAVLAGLAHVAMNLGDTIPMIGASGAIAAVMGAYLALYPSARLLMWAGPVVMRLPALVGLAGWFLVQVLASTAGYPGVSWSAHIGGFLAGIGLVVALRPADVPLWGAGGPTPRTPRPPPRRSGARRPYTPGNRRSLRD